MPPPTIRYDTDRATRLMHLCRALWLDKNSTAKLLGIKNASNVNAQWRGLDPIRAGVMGRLEKLYEDLYKQAAGTALALRDENKASGLPAVQIRRYDTQLDYERLAPPAMVAQWPVVALHHCFTHLIKRNLNGLGVPAVFSIELGDQNNDNH